MDLLKVIAIKDHIPKENPEMTINSGKIYNLKESKEGMFLIEDHVGNSACVPSEILVILDSTEIQPEEEKICNFCQKRIDGNFISNKKGPCHIECLSCFKCNDFLAEKPFFIHEGKNFCEVCENERKGKCDRCGESLRESYISALGKKWHPEHFLCKVCGEVNTKTYRTFNGEVYCQKCFADIFSAICNVCNDPISENDERLKVNDLIIHPYCFKCDFGKEILDLDAAIKVFDKKIYCREHYEQKFRKICAFCNVILKDDYVTFNQSDYHEHCLKCNECDQNLVQESPMLFENTILCKKHYEEKLKIGSPKNVNDEEETRMEGEDETDLFEKVSGEKVEWPENLNSTRKEEYLEKSIFFKVFEMDLAEFKKLPLWKQKRMKEIAGLM